MSATTAPSSATFLVAPIFAYAFSDTSIAASAGVGGKGLVQYSKNTISTWTVGSVGKPRDLADVAGYQFDPHVRDANNPVSILFALSTPSSMFTVAALQSTPILNALTAGARIGSQRQADLVAQLRRDAVHRHRSRISHCCVGLSRAWLNTQDRGPLLAGIYNAGAAPLTV